MPPQHPSPRRYLFFPIDRKPGFEVIGPRTPGRIGTHRQAEKHPASTEGLMVDATHYKDLMT